MKLAERASRRALSPRTAETDERHMLEFRRTPTSGQRRRLSLPPVGHSVGPAGLGPPLIGYGDRLDLSGLGLAFQTPPNIATPSGVGYQERIKKCEGDAFARLQIVWLRAARDLH